MTSYDIQDFLQAADKQKWLLDAIEAEYNQTYAPKTSRIQVGRLTIKVEIEQDRHRDDPNDWGNNRLLFRGRNRTNAAEAEAALGLDKHGAIPDDELDDCACELALETPLFKEFKAKMEWIGDADLCCLRRDLVGGHAMEYHWFHDCVTLVECFYDSGVLDPAYERPDTDDTDATADWARDRLDEWFKTHNDETKTKQRWWDKREAGVYGVKHAVAVSYYEHSGIHIYHVGGPATCMWDTSRNGVVWIPGKETIAELDAITDPAARDKRRAEIANGDIDVYNDFLSGNVWCHSVAATEMSKLDEDEGKVVEELYEDSCSGHYGDDWAEYVETCLDNIAKLIVEREAGNSPLSKDIVQVLREKDGVRSIHLESAPTDRTDDIEHGRWLCSAALGTTLHV